MSDFEERWRAARWDDQERVELDDAPITLGSRDPVSLSNLSLEALDTSLEDDQELLEAKLAVKGFTVGVIFGSIVWGVGIATYLIIRHKLTS